MSTVGQGASSDSSPQRFYTPSEIGSLYSSLPKSLPVQERAVASRAALRYKSHSDGLHLAVRHAGGLHPWYIAVHGNGKGSKEEQIEAINLLDGSLKDLFDAITAQDRIDGGITLLFRSPGYGSSGPIHHEDISLDAYLSPREFAEGGENLQTTVAIMAQAFTEDFVIPHLKRFSDRCSIEGVRPYNLPVRLPKHSRDDFSRLSSTTKDTARLNLQCLNPQNAKDSKAKATTKLHPVPPMLFAEGSDHPNVTVRKIKRGASSTPEQVGDPVFTSDLRSDVLSTMPIISIGLHTDAVLTRFNLDDSIIRQLRVLVTTVRDSRWESVLREPGWGLSYEQAVSLSKALSADIQGVPINRTESQRTISLGYVVLVCLLGLIAYRLS